MYVVAIAWLYVVIIMAATEANITAAIMTFLSYGLLPLALFLWLVGTPQRRRSMRKYPVDQNSDDYDRTDSEAN